MLKIKLPFVVNAQTLNKGEFPCKLRAGNRNYFYASFDFTEEWSDIPLKAIFRVGISQFEREIVKDGDEFLCQIPNGCMLTKGFFAVKVVGGDKLLTNDVYVKIHEGISLSNLATIGEAIIGEMALGYGG